MLSATVENFGEAPENLQTAFGKTNDIESINAYTRENDCQIH